MRKIIVLALATLMLYAEALAPALPADAIALPAGLRPAGIAIDRDDAYVSSSTDGAIYHINMIDGAAEVLAKPTGDKAGGLRLDDGKLFVAAGNLGRVRVLNSVSGELLAEYEVPKGGRHFINDLTRLGNSIYATDSFTPQLHKISLGVKGHLPKAKTMQTIAIKGMPKGESYNVSGIVSTPDEKALLVVNQTDGGLYRIDPDSGRAEMLPIGEADLKDGAGLLREGNNLFIARPRTNKVVVLELSNDGRRAKLLEELSPAGFQSPTAIARHDDRLFFPNADFSQQEAAGQVFYLRALPFPQP